MLPTARKVANLLQSHPELISEMKEIKQKKTLIDFLEAV